MRRILVVASVVLLAGGAATAYYVFKHSRFGGDVIGNSTDGFNSTQIVTVPPVPPRKHHHEAIISPMFGEVPEHLHVGVGNVRPPFHLVWHANGTSLVEFPPAVAYHHLYYAAAVGDLIAVSTENGRRMWTVKIGRCEAAGPAVGPYHGGTVYESFLNRGRCKRGLPNLSDGLLVAIAAGRSHAVRWERNLGATETSPTLVGNRLYLGSAAGDVYCLSAINGKTIWHYHVNAPVKGAISYDRGKVFFGAYDGNLYALGAGKGTLVWTAHSARDWGGGHGNFYSTPAVAYSRVYVGSTDGKVYAFDERTGKLAWAHTTGGYVYGSPAVYAGRILVGSYDHNFYALNAATGTVDWKYTANDPISGSATVVGGLVYFATLHVRRTYALDVATGKLVWSMNDGGFGTVVTDGEKIYIGGWGKIYAYVPQRSLVHRARHHHRHRRHR